MLEKRLIAKTQRFIAVSYTHLENIEIENDVYINTSHPEVNFNAEEVSDYDINLNINDDYASLDIFEYDEAEVEIQKMCIRDSNILDF